MTKCPTCGHEPREYTITPVEGGMWGNSWAVLDSSGKEVFRASTSIREWNERDCKKWAKARRPPLWEKLWQVITS